MTIWEEHGRGWSVWKGVHLHTDGTITMCASRDTREEVEAWQGEMMENDRYSKPVVEHLGTKTQQEISEVMKELEEILLRKNRAYGDSALDPVRIYSKASPTEQINVRIDDKLSRVIRGEAYEDEDIDIDLAGYYVLRIVARRRQQKENQK